MAGPLRTLTARLARGRRPARLTAVLLAAFALSACNAIWEVPDNRAGPVVTGSTTASVTTGPTPSAAPAPVVSSSSLGPTSGPAVSSGPQPLTGAAPVVTSTGPRLHTVQPGESLPGIAALYGVQVEAVAAANNLAPPYSVSQGQLLRIPEPGSAPGSYQRPPTPGATVSSNSLSPTPLVPTSTVPAGTRTGTAPVASAGTQVAVVSAPGGTISSAPAPFDPPLPGRRPGAPASVGTTTVAGTTTSSPLVTQNPGPGTGTITGTTTGSTTTASPTAGSTPPGAPTPIASTPLATTSPGNGATVTTAPPVGSPPVAGTPSTSGQATTGAGTTPSATAGQGQFLWPVDGSIISEYGPLSDGLTNDGINIAAASGTPIRAAQSGTVAYAGNELRGFGNLILIRHDGGWVTAYAHADQISVQRGQQVQAGQTIGTVGDTGSVTSPQLHFEIRQGSEPVDPMTRLAPR